MKKTILRKWGWVGLVGLGVMLRGWRMDQYNFGFDQVQILENAARIRVGDLTLIGPRTGPAEMFTGPLIYYVAAVTTAIMGEMPGLVAVGLVNALVTGGVLGWLVGRYMGNKQKWWVVALWAGSPFLVWLDRMVWNPNLSVIAAALVMLPLLRLVEKKKMRWSDVGIMAGGVFLGYQAHFGGLGLLPMAVVMWMLLSRKMEKKMVGVGMGLVTLVPTLVFDGRNGWLNVKGLLGFLDREVTSYHYFLIKQLGTSLAVTVENVGNLFAFETNRVLVWMVGVVVIGGWMVKNQKNKNKFMWVMGWLVMIVVGFSFYRGPLPAYYFLIQIPAGLVMMAEVVREGTKQWGKNWMMLLVLVGYAVALVVSSYGNDGEGLTMKNQVAAVTYVKGLENKGVKVAKVSWDMEAVNTVGMKYLMDELEVDKDGVVVHVGFPTGADAKKMKQFGAISVWLDPRVKKEKNYLETNEYIVETEAEVRLLGNKYLENELGSSAVYEVIRGKESIGWLAVYKREMNDVLYDELDKKLELGKTSWGDWVGTEEIELGWLMKVDNWILRFVDESPELGGVQELGEVKWYTGRWWGN